MPFIPVDSREAARQAAQEYLDNNPGKTLTGHNLYVLPDGTELRVRKKDGGRLSAENYDTKTKADKKRSEAEQPKTDAEAAYANSYRRIAQQQSQNTLHQVAADGQPSIAEHNQRLAAGGSNEYMSVSEPPFKTFKDSIEQKIEGANAPFIADIDNVTGGVRLILKNVHNDFEETSRQVGVTFEAYDDTALTTVTNIVRNADDLLTEIGGGIGINAQKVLNRFVKRTKGNGHTNGKNGKTNGTNGTNGRNGRSNGGATYDRSGEGFMNGGDKMFIDVVNDNPNSPDFGQQGTLPFGTV